jgi:hypothetical protein
MASLAGNASVDRGMRFLFKVDAPNFVREDLLPCVYTERKTLRALISKSVGAAGAAAAGALAPAANSDRRADIRAAFLSFFRALVDAGSYLRQENSAYSHIWEHDVWSAIVVHPLHRDERGVPLPAMSRFDAIADAWEAAIECMLPRAASG